MLTAMPYRHTHRNPSTGDPLPRSLLAGLQHDPQAEGCTLVLVDQPGRYQQLSALVTRGCPAAARQSCDPGRATALDQATGQPAP